MSAIKHHMIIRDEEGTPLISTKRGATVKDPEKFQACMDDADLAIYAAEEREPYHPVYIVAGWLAILIGLGIAAVLTAWAFRLI